MRWGGGARSIKPVTGALNASRITHCRPTVAVIYNVTRGARLRWFQGLKPPRPEPGVRAGLQRRVAPHETVPDCLT